MRKTFMLWLMAIFVGLSGFAQNVQYAVYGDTTTTSSDSKCPLPGYYGFHKSAVMYTGDELGVDAGSIITSIAWQTANFSSGTLLGPFKIYLFETSDDALTGSTVWSDLIGSATEVYNSTFNAVANSWATFTLSTPFTYNGGNLVVITDGQGCSLTGSCTKYCKLTGTSQTQAWTFCKDNSAIPDNETFTSMSTASMNHYKYNIRIGYEEGTVSCHAVNNASVSDISENDATVSWTAPDDGVSYIVQYKASDESWDGGNVSTIVTSDLFVNFSSSLISNTLYNVRIANYCGGNDTSAWRGVSFKTLCEPAYELPLIYDFETSDANTGLPDCWEKTSDGANNSPYTSTSYAYEGSRSLFAYGSSGIALLPEVDGNVYSISDLQLRFMLRRSSYSNVSLSVGFMNDVTDTVFVPYDTITLLQNSSNYGYEEQTVVFSNYTGGNARIALKVLSGSVYIDNLRLEEIPDCPPVQNITILSVDDQNATVTWEGSSDSYLVRYRAVSDSVWNETGAVVDGNTATLGDLEAVTSYVVEIAPDCPGTTEDSYRSATFTTACAAFDLPYTVDFESYTDMNCWTVAEEGYSYYFDDYDYDFYEEYFPRRTLYYSHEGSYSVAFGSMAGYEMVWAAPKMNESIENIRMEFFARISSTVEDIGTLQVGVMTNPSDTSTFTTVATVPVTSTAYALNVVSFNDANISGNNYYIAFRYLGAGNDGENTGAIYVDDIVIRLIPACMEPANVQVSNVTSNSADITWTSASSSFILYYKEAADSVFASDYGIADTTYTLGGLNPNTTYNVYVANLCDDGSESSSLVVTFTTTCASETVPFTESFDAASLPECWARYSGLASEVFGGSELVATNSGWDFSNVQVFGEHHGRLNIYGTMVKYWLVSPLIDLSGLSSPMLTFDIALTRYNNTTAVTQGSQADDKFMVVVSTDDGATWSEANATVWSNSGNDDYVYDQIPNSGEEVAISLGSYVGQSIRIAFYGESTAQGGDNDLHIDNVYVGEQAACATPTQLAVSDITSSSATVSWTQNDAVTDWLVEYDTAGFTPGNGIAINVSGTPSTIINNLEANTLYEVYVSALCSNGELTNAVHKTFTTECEMITSVPQVWNFDTLLTAGTASGPLPACWKRTGNLYPYSYSYSYHAHSGNRMLYFSNGAPACAVLPVVDVNAFPINTLQLSFFAKLSSDFYDAWLEVGVMTDPEDPASFELVQAVNLTTSYNENPYEVAFTDYTGIGSYIAVRNTSSGDAYNYIYLDDLMLDLAPACTRPHSLTSDASTTSATLSWVTTAPACNVYYKPSVDSIWQSVNNVTLNNGSYVLAGLTPGTHYDWYVETACGGDELASEPAQFVTNMVAVSLPYSTDFSNGQGWLLNNGSAHNYWTVGTPEDSIHSALFVTYNGTTAGYSVSSQSVVMAEKLFTMPSGDSVHVEFDLTVGGEVASNNVYDYLKVFLVPADEDFVAGTAQNTQSPVAYNTYAMDFSADSMLMASSPAFPFVAALSYGSVHISKDMLVPVGSSEAKLVFLWRNDGSGATQPGAIIRNFSISEPGAGPVITNPTVATNAADPVAQTTATLHATITNPDNVSITAKGFEWKATTGGAYTQVSGSGTGNTFSANLTNLTPNTSYTYKAYITFNGQTVYGNELTFTTLPEDTPDPCETPTNLHASEFDAHSITIGWNANGNATSWKVRYRVGNGDWVSADATTNTYVLTGLVAETVYEIEVQADCGGGNLSDWSAPIHISTSPDGIDSWLESSVTLFPNPAKEVVNVQCTMYDVQSVEVYDVFGKLINTVVRANNYSSQQTCINVSGLADGMYFVRVRTDRGSVTKSFVKK